MDNFKSYDLVVVGSGLAAVSLAKYASKSMKVLIIEGGAEAQQEQYRQLTLNDEYGHFSNHWSNHWLRVVGGTSRAWQGWMATLDARDFEGHNGLPKWPITLSDLKKYYLAAASFLGRPEAIALKNRQPLLNQSVMFKPFSIGEIKRINSAEDVKVTDNIDLMTETNVIKLFSNNRKTISGLFLSKRNQTVEFAELGAHQKVVIACGGLGNAQILLQPTSSSDVGVGNESGLVGRYLMEHPHAKAADAYLNKDIVNQMNAYTNQHGFGQSTPALTLPDHVYQSQNLLACTLAVQSVTESVDDFGKYWQRKFNAPIVKAMLYARSEQEPQAGNRVTLVNEKNEAGLFKLRTEVTFSSLDLNSIYNTTRLLGEALANQKAGVVKIDNNGIYRGALGGGHTMGTTRMGFTSKDSVCDKNCKVHGYDNLYLAGSSVFTTSGASNPTITIVALAIRLAEHIIRIKKGTV